MIKQQKDEYIKGYKARQTYRQRRIIRELVWGYIKEFSIVIALLLLGWIIAVVILSI
jgi:hypothetical protein|tara:strand:+ start:18716 stop:18886 length:171 start_codon:yes stop_codon:yes gene_type:complete